LVGEADVLTKLGTRAEYSDIAVDALATARLTRLLVQDSIFDRQRQRVQTWADAHVPVVSKILDCAWCSSVYVGAGVVVARRAFPRAWGAVAYALACSQVAGMASETLS
jgi:hypothetical protein